MTVGFALALAACGGTAREGGSPAPVAAGSLSHLSGHRVLLFPARHLTTEKGPAWSAQVGDHAAFLRGLDDEIAFALRERPTGVDWVLPDAIARAAARARGMATDPYAVGMEPLRSGKLLASGELGEPLASQLRALAALHDARFVLAPVELRFERASGSTPVAGAEPGIAILRVALIDARLAKAVWTGEVRGEPETVLSPAIAASLAGRFADLIAAP